MTPNKPVIAEEARKMLTSANSKLENNLLDMVARLADVITYNAEATNKLVQRVDELEKLVVQKGMPKKAEEVGEYLEELLKDTYVTHVKCTYAASTAFTLGKVYTVEIDNLAGQKRHVRSNHTSMFQEGIKYTRTTSRFAPWGQPTVKTVIGSPLQVLLAQQHVMHVKCVKSESHMWKEGKDYRVLVNTSDNTRKVVCSETGKPLSTSRSLFVEVTEKSEPCTLDLYDIVGRPNFTDDVEQFFEVTRMFMGLPTVQLIHPRSL